MKKLWMTLPGILIEMNISGLMQTIPSISLPTIDKTLDGMEY